MLTRLARCVVGVSAAVMLGGVAVGGGQAVAAPAAPTASASDVAQADAALAAPGVVRSVVLDAATGAVLVDKREAPSAAHPAAFVYDGCNGNADSCWTARVPYKFYGFSGKGAVNGNWPNRGAFQTKSHYAAVCWNNNICSGGYGPGSTIGFNAPVTGKKVTNIS